MENSNDRKNSMMKAGTVVLSPAGIINTPQKARDEARKFNGNTRILVESGCYPLSEPLVLNETDSGTVWKAVPGGSVIFSGGEKITGWKTEKYRGKTVWTAELAPGRRIRGLWSAGKRRERSFLPKKGWYRFTGTLDYVAAKLMDDGPLTVCYAQNEIQQFHNLEDVEIVALEWWCESHLRIAGVDSARNEVTFNKKPLRDMRGEDGGFARYRICNVYEALELPGEWYYDRKSGKLSYLPEEDERMETTEIIVSDMPELLRIQGTEENPAKGIRFENISFQHCGWEQNADAADSHQGAILIPGAVVMEYAHDCALYRCEIAHATSAGIEIGKGCHGTTVAACRIHDLGAGGIKIMHEKLPMSQSTSEQYFNPAHPVRMNACVTDCEIYDGGHDFKTACGILIGNSGGNRIFHNEIRDFPYTGISLGWIWGFHMMASRGGRNLIEYNHIHHINDGVLSDNGGIYSLGPQPGSRITGNYIHDIGCFFYGGNGIYPDQGSSGLVCRDNLVRNVKGQGYNVHFGRFLKTVNNIFLGTASGLANFGRSDLSFENDFSANLLAPESAAAGNCRINPLNHRIANCRIKPAPGNPIQWPDGNLRETAEKSRNWNGCREDDFVLDENTLMPEGTTAAEIGFEPFDFRKAGLRNGGRFPDDFSEYALPEQNDGGIVESCIEDLKYSRTETEWKISFALTIRNSGTETVSGKYGFSLFDDVRLKKVMLAEKSFKLLPEETGKILMETSLPLDEISTDAHQCWVKAEGDEIRIFSSACEFYLPPAPKQLPRYPAEFTGRSETLSGLDFEIPEDGGHLMLRGKCLLTGDVLTVAVSVFDPDIKVNESCIWEGSIVELFLAASPGAEIQQYALVPPHHGNFRDFRQEQPVRKTSLFPAELRYETEKITDGWSFLLKLPLKGVQIDPEFFCFDLICRTSSNIPMYDYIRLPVWGSLFDYASSYFLAPLAASEPVSENQTQK